VRGGLLDGGVSDLVGGEGGSSIHAAGARPMAKEAENTVKFEQCKAGERDRLRMFTASVSLLIYCGLLAGALAWFCLGR